MREYLIFDGEIQSDVTVVEPESSFFAFDTSLQVAPEPSSFITVGTPGETVVTVTDTGNEFFVFDTISSEVTSIESSVDFLLFDTEEPKTTVATIDDGSDFIVITSGGPKGDRGEPGPIDSSQGSYVHVQSVAALTWNIYFDLPFMPSIIIVDSAGSVVGGDILIVGPGHYQLNFTAPFSGSAYLS